MFVRGVEDYRRATDGDKVDRSGTGLHDGLIQRLSTVFGIQAEKLESLKVFSITWGVQSR